MLLVGDMRLMHVFLLGLIINSYGVSLFAFDKEILKERKPNLFIKEPSPAVSPLWPAVQKLYQRRMEAVAYIVTEDGITGSGTVISRSFGLIITNRHVVGSESIVSIVFEPPTLQGESLFKKEDIYSARVLKTDSIRDLALLEVISPPKKMSAVPLGSTSRLEVGQNVFSVSHSQNLLWNYTGGVITQIQLEYEWISDLGAFHRASGIQILTPTGRERSGDPLFDINGNFIGLFSGSSSTKLNFVITIDEIREFVLSALRPTIILPEGQG
jgi:putative serine protease PepD